MGKERLSILCPNCRKLISRDEAICPYCKISAPGSFWKTNPLVQGFLGEEGVIHVLLGVNIVFYAISILFDPSALAKASGLLSFASPSNQSLFFLGATGVLPIRLGHWWSLLNANYLHGGLLHLAFNMYALKQLGPLVVKEFGVQRFIGIYTLGGVGGFVISYYPGNVPFTIGASASVCALIGAILFFGYKRGGTYGNYLFRQAGSWVLWLGVFGFVMSGINNWGHGGGLICGALLALALGYKDAAPERLVHKMIGAICVLGTIASLGWGVYRAFLWKLS